MGLRRAFLVISGLALGATYAEDIGVPDMSAIEYPDGRPHSREEVELGKTLFYDNRLSINKAQSCATCHNPDLGFGDGLGKGIGTHGKPVARNTPHIYNLAWNTIFFWDGRAATLEEQALGPIQAAGEMDLPLDSLAPRLKKVPYYRSTFQKIYGNDAINPENVAKAIAAFERSMVVVNTPFDRYMKGDRSAMIPVAIRGMELFKGKANCVACHSGPNFTDESFHNIGVADKDEGRNAIMKGATMVGAFKTPGLRNTLLTAPYMHDGSEKTLEDVVRFYNQGGKGREGVDKLIKPLGLSEVEIMELVAFMGALTDPIKVIPPKVPLDQ